MVGIVLHVHTFFLSATTVLNLIKFNKYKTQLVLSQQPSIIQNTS